MPSLAAAVVAGLPHARIAFGEAGDEVAGGALLDEGSALFGDGADGDAVGALLTNDRASVAVLAGALAAGSRLVSLPPPSPSQVARPEVYAEGMRALLAAHGLARVVVSDEYAGLLEAIGVPAVAHSALGRAPLAAGRPDGFSLVQFSSGTTGPPKGIALSDERLAHNVAAFLEALGPRPGDGSVSWLPLSHDMGLVGMLLGSLATREYVGEGRITLLDPLAFLRDPACWPRTIERTGATFTAAPPFALGLVARRGRPGAHDLSSVRALVVGGEAIHRDALRGFVDAAAGSGLDAGALCPAYGMAEVGLAVSLSRPGDDWDVGRTVEVDGVGAWMVASGPPVPGTTVRVAGGAGAGRLEVASPSIGVDSATGAELGDDGVLLTGDHGCVVDGLVHVLGRVDDVIVVRGRNLFAPALEAAAGAVEGVRPGRVLAVADADGRLVVAAETLVAADGALRADVARAVAEAGGFAPDEVRLVGRGELPFTTSGKPQRLPFARELLSG